MGGRWLPKELRIERDKKAVELLEQGYSNIQIAGYFSTSQQTIRNILNRKRKESLVLRG